MSYASRRLILVALRALDSRIMALYNSITIITSPYRAGEKDYRVGRGPKAFLEAGLLERIAQEVPNVKIDVIEIEEVKQVNTEVEGDIGRSFAVLRNISKAVRKAAEAGSWPLVLSGNCMDVVAVNAGLNPDDPSVVGDTESMTREVIWFDAHADLETPDTTESGYLGGMGGSMLLREGFGHLLGRLPGYRSIEGESLVAVGFRSMSEYEEEKIGRRGIKLVRGGKSVDGGQYAESLSRILKKAEEGTNTAAVLHVDVDVMDTSVGRANDFAVEGGLGARDLLECVDLIGNKRRVEAMHVASLDPGREGWENIVKAAIKAVVLVAMKVMRD